MIIEFTPLTEENLPLLLKWLETPHVKKWWDQNVKWTSELIQKKYSN
jgi:aminoglycoside 6'-N-acetyltransferase